MISSVKINLDMMKNSSHWDEYPAMQSCGPLPQVSAHHRSDCVDVHIVASMVHHLPCISTGNDGGCEGSVCCLFNYHMHLSHPLYHSDPPIRARHSIVRIYVPLHVRSFIDISLRCQL